MSETDAPAATAPTDGVPSSFSEVGVDDPVRLTARDPLPGAPRSEHAVLAAAACIAVLADLIAVDRPPGIGLTLALLSGLGAILGLHGRFGLRLPSRNRLLVAGAVALLAIACSLRASVELLTVNAVAIFVGMVLLSVRVEGRQLRDARAAELALALVELPVACAKRSWFVVARGTRRRPAGEAGNSESRGAGPFGGHGRDIVIGFLVAVPILVVFASLLAASDAGFRRILEQVFDFDIGAIARHAYTLVWTGVLAMTALVAALASAPTSRIEERRVEWAGPAAVGIVLGSTCALFAAFLAVQGSYLFGGANYLEKRTGLTAAEYARDGFYELLVVSGLSVVLLLAARASFRTRAGSTLAYRLFAPLLSLLAIVLLGSAMARLLIYADRFGLTTQRIYAVAILAWIAAVLAWLAVRIARDRSLQLGAFAGCTGLLAILAVNAVNPEGLAASTNLDRRGPDGDSSIDTSYLMTLGEDATPAIVARLNRLPKADAARIERDLRQKSRARRGDWRSANLAHHRAEAALDG